MKNAKNAKNAKKAMKKGTRGERKGDERDQTRGGLPGKTPRGVTRSGRRSRETRRRVLILDTVTLDRAIWREFVDRNLVVVRYTYEPLPDGGRWTIEARPVRKGL